MSEWVLAGALDAHEGHDRAVRLWSRLRDFGVGKAPPDLSQWQRVFVALAVGFVGAKVLLFALLAMNSLYVMDEYQQGGYSQYIEEGFYRGMWPFKTVLYAYYYALARAVTDHAVRGELAANFDVLGSLIGH